MGASAGLPEKRPLSHRSPTQVAPARWAAQGRRITARGSRRVPGGHGEAKRV